MKKLQNKANRKPPQNKQTNNKRSMGRGKGASRRQRTPQGPAPTESSYSLGLEGRERDGVTGAGGHLGAQVEDGSAVVSSRGAQQGQVQR